MPRPRGNPQLEDGHTRIANELLEAMIRYPFTGGEIKVVLAVIRLTYGWQLNERQIRQRELVLLTGLDARYLQRVLAKLRQRGVLFRNRYMRPHCYALNKHYLGWRGMPQHGFPVRFDQGATTPAMNLSGKPGHPVLETVVAPGPWARTYKDRKIKEKESPPDPTVQNLLQCFAQIMARPLTATEIELIAPLHDLSPSQAQQLLEQAAAQMSSQPTGGVDGRSESDSPEPVLL